MHINLSIYLSIYLRSHTYTEIDTNIQNIYIHTYSQINIHIYFPDELANKYFKEMHRDIRINTLIYTYTHRNSLT